MDETSLKEMAKAYNTALKGRNMPKTRPFPTEESAPSQNNPISALLVRELTAVEFLLQCAVKNDKKKLLSYLRSLLHEVIRHYPTPQSTSETARYVSPEIAKIRLVEYDIDRLALTDTYEKNDTLYAINSRILALISLV